MKLLLVLVGALQCHRTSCSNHYFNDSQMPLLQRVMGRYCPKVTSLTCDAGTEEDIACDCCSDCSCKQSCGLTGNCCYKEDNADKLDEERIRCMTPSTKGGKYISTTDLPMYKFVVGPPVGGCVAEGSCNSSEQLIPWKTFYPVYSRSKKMNYISEECAGCHGVIDGIKWISKVSFTQKASLNRLFEDLWRNSSPKKYLLFVHPGNGSENMQGVCSFNTVSSCLELTAAGSERYQLDIKENFPDLNVSFENFQDGCLNGPHLPIFYQRAVYKNLFCVLCNRIVPNFVNRIGTDSDNPLVFSAIIDVEFVHQISEENSSKKHLAAPIACRAGIESSCRPVLCPIMQLRTDNGSCILPSKSWLMPTPLIVLNLTTFNSNHVNLLLSNITDEGLVTAFYEQSPWEKCWRIHTMGVRSYMIHSTNITEFLLEIKCSLFEIEPLVLMTSIKKSLSKYWNIKTKTGVISLYQEISSLGHPSKVHHPTLRRHVFGQTLYLDPEQSFHSMVSIPYWEILIDTFLWERSITLHKPFFCSQILLRADEYDILFHPFLIIRYISSQRLFFEKEIVVRQISDEEREIQICLEDSDFEIINGKAVTHNQFERFHLLWLVFIKVIL